MSCALVDRNPWKSVGQPAMWSKQDCSGKTAPIQLMSCLWQACSCISLSLPKDQLLGHSLKTTDSSEVQRLIHLAKNMGNDARRICLRLELLRTVHLPDAACTYAACTFFGAHSFVFVQTGKPKLNCCLCLRQAASCVSLSFVGNQLVLLPSRSIDSRRACKGVNLGLDDRTACFRLKSLIHAWATKNGSPHKICRYCCKRPGACLYNWSC